MFFRQVFQRPYLLHQVKQLIVATKKTCNPISTYIRIDPATDYPYKGTGLKDFYFPTSIS